MNLILISNRFKNDFTQHWVTTQHMAGQVVLQNWDHQNQEWQNPNCSPSFVVPRFTRFGILSFVDASVRGIRPAQLVTGKPLPRANSSVPTTIMFHLHAYQYSNHSLYYITAN